MAYISTEEVKNIREKLKAEFPRFKFSVRKSHHTSVDVNILKGPVDFSEIATNGHHQVNPYHLYMSGKFESLFSKMLNIIKSQDWFDESDSMVDYFHTAYYFSLSVGDWNKPYVQVK